MSPRRILAPSLLLLLAASCRREQKAPEENVETRSTPRVTTSALPVDRTLPGELAEGTEKAFGLALPRVSRIAGRFEDVVMAELDVSADRVSNYIRQRVTAEKIAIGPLKTVFSRAIVRGQPSVELSIEVIMHDGTSELIVRNLSLVKPRPDLTNEEERWRAAGFKPDGTLLDPTHLQ
jgi:hypothetical protein